MGDTYGAWEVLLDDQSRHLFVAKSFSTVQREARLKFGPGILAINLIGTGNPAKNPQFRSVEVME